MTKEQAIEKAKEQYSEIWDCDINHPKYEDTVEEIVTGVIRLIMHSPTDDCVSLGVYNQVMWERDIAIEQLKELGYEFGEKIMTSDDCVSRQAVCDAIMKCETMNEDSADGFIKSTTELEAEIACLPPVTPTQSWISVDERLPEENGEYMITWITSCLKGGKHRFIGTSEYEVTNEYDYENNRFKGEWLLEDFNKLYYPDVKVIAWQPLPKSYEEKWGDSDGSN